MKLRFWGVAGLVCLAISTRVEAIDWDKVTFNGYTSLEIERQLEPKGEGRGDPHTSFDAKEFDIVLNIQATDSIRATANIIWEHGPATEDGRGNIALEYGFVEYSYSDLFRFRAGKMLTPFGVFNEIHTAKIAFLSVQEPLSLNKPDRIVKSAFRFYPRYGSGLSFLGDGMIGSKRWEYVVFIANGDQIVSKDDPNNPYELDDNNSKSVTARIRLEPTESFRVGGSYYRDSYSAKNKRYRSLAASGLEFEFNRGGLQVLAEAAFASRENIDRSKTREATWYIQPAFHFENGVTPYVRYDWVDPDRDKSSDQGHDLIVGVNYEFQPGFMVRIENNWFKGQKNTDLASYPGGDYNEIKASIVLGW